MIEQQSDKYEREEFEEYAFGDPAREALPELQQRIQTGVYETVVTGPGSIPVNLAPAAPAESPMLDGEWCMDAFWRVNPGRNATVPSLYLLDFAREVLRVHAARSATTLSAAQDSSQISGANQQNSVSDTTVSTKEKP